MKNSYNVFAYALTLPVIQASTFLPYASLTDINATPYGYRDIVPSLEHVGNFGLKNESVMPWNVGGPPYNQSSNYSTPAIRTRADCSVQSYGQQSQFWLPNIAHQGTSPFLVNGTDYLVYRNVKDFGAKGDGVTDDTAAFNSAILNGDRCKGGQCGGTTGKPALVYVPPGTYMLSSTVQMLINTQIIGDAVTMPTLKAAAGFRNGSILINGYDSGQPSLNNFYIGVRNVNLDTTAAPIDNTIFALNWAVSQATNLINVNFILRPHSNHVGIEMDGGSNGGGSGMFMGDLTFSGGLIGILFNNQQYAIRNVKFTNVATGIAFQHAFVVTLQQIHCVNVGVCVDLGAAGVTGSVNIIDSWCETCGTVVSGNSQIVLENFDSTGSGPMLYVDGATKVSGSLKGQTYAVGKVHYDNDGKVVDSSGTYLPYTSRGSLVDSNGLYFTKSQPQYTNLGASSFASVKDTGARGDGQTDDTAAINAALRNNANCKITYFPHGVYVVTDTIYVPPGSRIVGEIWSIITASGARFNDASNPRPMIQVGKPGEVGLAEISDMLFTVADVLPGAILVEVNMAGSSQGAVSFHNTHTRVGGAADSLTESTCQSKTDPCKAAFMHVHLTKTSSSYIENAWLWTADHDLDATYPITMGVGRGMLVEAQGAGTWLVGTGSEHQVLYAYQFHNAQNVQASMMQVETPYWQPSPPAPYPWAPDARWADPTFDCQRQPDECRMQWHLRILGSDSHTLPLYGEAFWVFFNEGSSSCSGPDATCQTNAVDIQGLSHAGGQGVELFNLNTRAVYDLVRLEGASGPVVASQPDNYGSWGGNVVAYLGFQ